MRIRTKLRRAVILLVSTAVFYGTGPENIVRLSGYPDLALAKRGGGHGGFSGRGGGGRPSGARAHGGNRAATRPSRPSTGGQRPSRPAGAVQRPSQGATRPSAPATRPSAPATRPSAPAARPARPEPGTGPRPEQPIAARPGTSPPAGQRPPGSRPPGERPPGARPPGQRPPGARPPGNRPPGSRPPGARPPGGRPPVAGRPPGWNPPNHRPPGYRPPYYPPPYYRPPHYRYGSYYYSPSWGWYFTAGLVGATLVYVATLPDDKNCEKVKSSGEDLYVCDGVLYRPTYKDGDLVYEIVSDDPNETPPATKSSQAVDVVGLSLTQPMTTGPAVRELQQVLLDSGYDPGGVDGTFGSGTKTALLWLQYDYGLEQTGMVDEPTAELLGFLPPSSPPADDAAPQTESSEQLTGDGAESSSEAEEAPSSEGETPNSDD